MRLLRYFAEQLRAAFLILAAIVGVSGQAHAVCSRAPTVSVSVQPTLPSYNPFMVASNVTSVISITNNGNAACGFSLSFSPNSIPAHLASGASTLTYTIVGSGVQLEYVWAGAGTPPTAAQRVNFLNVAKGATVTQTVVTSVATGQVVASGTYTDTFVTADVWDNTANVLTFWSNNTFNISETVLAVCSLPAPTIASMDFSSAITLGLPNAASIQTSAINNAQCTSPTKVRLTGTSMQTSPLGTARPNFDNFIDWTATATFGLATASVTTTGLTAAPAVNSAIKNTATAGATSGNLSITNVHLVASQHLLAGAYSGVLTIQIDPSF